MDLKVKGLVGKRRIIIESERTTDLKNTDIQYYLSNALMLRDKNIIRQYHIRNWIEVYYSEVKDFIGGDDSQVRSTERVSDSVCFVAYRLIQWLQHAKFLKELEKKLKTFGKILIVFRIYLRKKKHECIAQKNSIFNPMGIFFWQLE